MKIKNYKLFLEGKRDIDSICNEYDITNYTINDDGTVDVDGNVDLFNKGLTELPFKFGKVSGNFNCDQNQLTSLEGSPNWVGKYFSCAHNLLTTLEGGPKVVIKNYYCECNEIFNFKGFPEDFDKYIDFSNNPVYNLLDNIPEDKWIKFIYWCNEYDAIKDNGEVIPERMEEVYNKLGLIQDNHFNI